MCRPSDELKHRAQPGAVEKPTKSIHDKPPSFTLKELREAIPAHCFERSAAKGFLHIAMDLGEIALWAGVMLWLDVQLEAWPVLRWAAWALFWFYEGTTMFGLWIIAHECGHGAFSASQGLNDVVGCILHSALYVPYFAWQASHARHHHYTNHMDKDEPFVPVRVSESTEAVPYARTPFMRTLRNFTVTLLIGLPCYLLFNLGGESMNKGKGPVSHFDPNGPWVKHSEKWKIHVGNGAIAAWTFILYLLCETYGAYYVLWLYVPSLVVCNAYLSSVTLLQHTHIDVPHFDEGEWNWLRGAISTIDRDLGAFLNYKTHKIVDTHVVHHIFSTLPFYHADEATEAVKKVMGPYYNQDKTFFPLALWRAIEQCNYVEGQGVLHWLRSELSQ
eukprot:comp20979_c0_seq1/m.28096 comp20979_c0_seq1/g.28096  ORF comp20979_c0_seq1/g.28096 comp20979_c0_seq1/m.28096 type:complete len:388 (-) comp20979_c0_seq1:393-1556(-)